MNQAFAKNSDAIRSTFGSSALAERLQSVKIGVWSEGVPVSNSGVLLAKALGQVLGRLWLRIDLLGNYADTLASSLLDASNSGNQELHVGTSWNPPYDFIVAIGCEPPLNNGPGIRVGANGWSALLGSQAILTDDLNPVGPAAAAALVGAETFKQIFQNELNERAVNLPSVYEWNALTYGKGLDLEKQNINLEDIHVFGVGAVTHGLIWILENWPFPVTGTIHLIDHDKYDFSNAQRYVGMSRLDVDEYKVNQVAKRLRKKHPNLNIISYAMDMNSFYSEYRTNCKVQTVVVGVDSAEQRRQLAIKLPKRLINMWTEGDHLGAARFGFNDGWPCLFCAYPEEIKDSMDETGVFHRETGLPPYRIRELLNSGEGLTEDDVAIINCRYYLDRAEEIKGKPLRTVRGVLCATGKIQIHGSSAVEDVPFVFSSFLAGVAGFSELYQEIVGISLPPGHWQTNVLKYPTAHTWQPRAPKQDCYLCTDNLVSEILM